MNLNTLTKSELIDMVKNNTTITKEEKNWYLMFSMFYALLEKKVITANKIASWYLLDWLRVDKIWQTFCVYIWPKMQVIDKDTKELDFDDNLFYKYL